MSPAAQPRKHSHEQPDRQRKTAATEEFLAGGGETGAMIRQIDWSKTPLGPVALWPNSLRTAVRIILTSRQPMFVWWGPQLINLYNDAYKAIVGGKHPAALGQPASKVWHEIWDQIGPRAQTVMEQNVGTYDESLLLIMERHGYSEETYYTFSYSPIPGDNGGTEGIICANTDDTRRLVGERQLTTLREISARMADARTAAEACRLSAGALAGNPWDIPFALLYTADADAQRLRLAGRIGLPPNHKAAPKVITIGADDQTDSRSATLWPVKQALRDHQPQLVTNVDTIFENLPSGKWPRSPHQAVVVPLPHPGNQGHAGVIIAGLSPYRIYDEAYESFIHLMAGEVAANIANATAYEVERRRAESLAELDRAKTNFFSNVSHEFRTPLTLMLGPLEDLMYKPASPPPSSETQEQLSIVYRNGLRLQKLVNALLDFSRIEAGRVQAVYTPTDLAALTIDLASNFRSAIEKAGMELRIMIRSSVTMAYVDREMWEKIVLNLLSNAFKYTMRGHITVALRERPDRFELSIKDTGIGIRPEDVPRLFERFHRIQNTEARTHEGTGIGLSLVYELVKLHAGDIQVTSTYGKGTVFRVTIPKGKNHLPPEQVTEQLTASALMQDEPFIQEAERWLASDAAATNQTAKQNSSPDNPERSKIVLADDNTDMRQYLTRLLERSYDVVAVADGQAALRAVQTERPDLVVTDIMMPRLDGFGLLKAIRQDQAIMTTPVIMLSARAGEEARIEGLDAGADDYLVKPFGTSELLARVSARLELSRAHRMIALKVTAERERLYGIFMHAPTPIAVISGPDLVFELANAHYCKFLGVNHAIDGRPLMEVVPDMEPDLVAIVRRVAFKGERFTANELPVVFDWNEDGQVYPKYFNLVYEPLFDDKKPNGLIAFATEITEQVLARQKIVESEARLRFMAESMPQKIFTITPDGTINYMNPQWETYTGIPIAQLLIDKRARDGMVHPDDVMGARKVWRALFKAGQPIEYEYRLQRKDGIYRWHISRVNPMKDKNGAIVMWIGSNTDIDDMKRTAERKHELEIKTAVLTKQSEQLIQLNQAKDEFISLASHQLRTPATGVKQYIGMLLQGYVGDLTDDQKVFLQTAYESNERQITIVNDLLQVAQIDAGKVRLQKNRTDLVQMVGDIIDEQASKFSERNQTVIFKPVIRKLIVRADKDRIRMVLENIIDNAGKYTHPGKNITVSIRMTEHTSTVSVRDQGVGMASADIDKIFNKFSRLDNPLSVSSEGSGLGLYWAKKIIDLHDGTIAVSSVLGKGTTFAVTLPNM